MEPNSVLIIFGIILAASLVLLRIVVTRKTTVSKSNPVKYSKKRMNLSKIKFEIDDPRCGNCVKLRDDKLGKICNCVCHSDNNPFVKYHDVNFDSQINIT